jgi:DNA processing protein
MGFFSNSLGSRVKGSSGKSGTVYLGPGALSQEDVLHWLALRMTPGLGTRKAGQLIEIFRTPKAIFRTSKSELESAGLAAAVAQSVVSGCAFEDAADQQQKMAEAGAELVPMTDPRYPAALKEIFDAPPVLYAKGRVEMLGKVMLGIVGTRRPTAYGTAAATRLSKDLANAGMTIVSGMARGIDTSAHKAALEAGGDTVAVFGCGVDQVYPAENRKLAEEIAKTGLVISEFPMGTPPYPQNFPIRNRIISGMSVGVLVVEGSEYSGSAITAKLAAEQNREVFAVPGNITSKLSWGPNLLIKQGAKLVQEWNDVVVELKPEIRRALVEQCRNRLIIQHEQDGIDLLPSESASSPETNQTTEASLVSRTVIHGSMEGVARTVLKALQPDSAISLDHLMDTIEGCSSSEILAALFELELAGLVRQLPGKTYTRVWGD